jgi:hypothetical protein
MIFWKVSQSSNTHSSGRGRPSMERAGALPIGARCGVRMTRRRPSLRKDASACCRNW